MNTASLIPDIEISFGIGSHRWHLLGVQVFHARGWTSDGAPFEQGPNEYGYPGELSIEVGLAIITLRLCWTLSIPTDER